MSDSTFNVSNIPNAAKIIDSLRMVGYDNISALADLIDNAIDADAKAIQLQIKPDIDGYTIYLADNGCGMDLQTLDEALKLGSDTRRDETSDLGKYGMGLVTASLSLCRRITVITKSEDSPILTSIQDIDIIKEKNSFVKELRESTNDEIMLFKSFLNNKGSGTLVVLSKCDQIQDKNIDNLTDVITKSLGQIFRLFIQSGREISVSNKKVIARDPLMSEDPQTKIMSDESFPITTMSGQKESVRVKIAMLPDVKESTTGTLNITNQGIYVMRNNREITAGVTLDVFTKHNDYNRFRAEVYFSGDLDQEMRVEFTKRDLKPKQNILKAIKDIIYPQLMSLRKEIKREQVRSNDKEEIHKQSAQNIAQKSQLLIKPDIKIEKRKSPENTSGSAVAKDTGQIRNPNTIQNIRSQRIDVEFQVRNMSTNGPLFDVDQIGRRTLITYNADHPFYMKVFAENNDDSVKTYIDYLIYSLATAKLKTFDEDQLDRIESYMSVFSSNLRTLMR